MGGMITVIIVVIIVATKLTSLKSDNAPKKRYQAWQNQLEAGKKTAVAKPVAKSQPQKAQPAPTAKRNAQIKQTRQADPAIRQATKPQPAATRSTKSKQTKPVQAAPKPAVSPARPVMQAHESKLQRDARLHRKPLVPPRDRLKPPHKSLKPHKLGGLK